jgi:hypothetical protein
VQEVAVESRKVSSKYSQHEAGVGAEQQKIFAGKPSADGPSPASQEEKLESLLAMRSNLMKFFALIQHIAAKIDAAFAGQPFLPDLRPDAPSNKRRFDAYIEQLGEIARLLVQAQELWTLSFGFAIVREIRPAKRRRRKPTKVMSEVATGFVSR